MLSAFLLVLATLDVKPGTWRAWLDSPGGELPFVLAIDTKDGQIISTLKNGPDSESVPETRVTGDDIVFSFPHYDATVSAKITENGTRLDGEWVKRKGVDAFARLHFHARAEAIVPRKVDSKAATKLSDVIANRWSVRFEKSPGAAVGIFALGDEPGSLTGTFATATGDFRYLAGRVDDSDMTLACFDGAHAFLFQAKLRDDGTLQGTFHSGDAWSETWTAKRDPNAALDDEMSHARWNDGFGLAQLEYPDLSGNLVSLGDPRNFGKARILQLSGSWCPNCQDETSYLKELDAKYRDRGLSITTLCFETTGEREHDTAQAQRLLQRHGARFPALLAGRNDRVLAQQALPALDTLFAFPTTIFLHKDGRVRAVHAGFSGPATGEDYTRLRERFEKLVQELIDEPAPLASPVEDVLVSEMWRDERNREHVTFTRQESGTIQFDAWEMTRFDRPTKTTPTAAGLVEVTGASVWFADTTWQFDARAKVLLDPRDRGHRLTPAARSPFPVVDDVGYSELPQIVEGLASTDATRRRESAYYLAVQLVTSAHTPREFGGGMLDPTLAEKIVPLVSDSDPLVRATASWAVGHLGAASATKALVENLAHGFAPVRRESARALGKLRAESAVPALTKLANDIDPLVRSAANDAVRIVTTPK